MSKRKTERNKKILELRDKNGWPFMAIARKFRITKKRAWELYYDEKARV